MPTLTVDRVRCVLVFDDNLSLVVRKPVFGFSDQVRHKLGCTQCTATENG